MKKTCAGCRALEGAYKNPCTGGYRIIREAGCGLGRRTDGAMHPKEECEKPVTWREFERVKEALREAEDETGQRKIPAEGVEESIRLHGGYRRGA
ncbi:MAG: hypothetical protein ACSW75_06310 [Lachnospiraceae bacterium]